MKYLLFILILVTVLITSGCVSGERKSDVTPTISKESTPAAIQTTINTTSVPTTYPTQTSTALVTTQNLNETKSRIPDNKLNALIQDSKNKLNMWKQSDKADTIVTKILDCEIIKSKEIGYLIDATDGNTYFIKGDYGSIRIAFMTNKNHEYVFLHSHPRNFETCTNGSYIRMTYNYNTFSIQDLSHTGELTNQGYHILKIYAISDYDYEIFPKKEFDWKSEEVINLTIQKMEKDLELTFNNNVDDLMPILAQRLNYRYIVNNQILV